MANRVIKKRAKVESKVEKIAFLSDLHIPYQSKRALEIVLNFLGDYNANHIILGGDIFDCYQVSDYSRDPGRTLTLQDEFDHGRPFIEAIDYLAPKVSFMLGNHEDRLQRLIGRNPGLYNLRALKLSVAAELPKAWKFYPSQAQLQLGNLTVLHGDLRELGSGGINPARTMFNKLKRSSLFGHFHRFASHYDTNYNGDVRITQGNGHLSDLAQVCYMTAPDWQMGITTVEVCGSGAFAIQPRIIDRRGLLADGKEYSL